MPNKDPYQKKSLSQVFLKTKEPCLGLARVLQSHSVQTVLEIGPGGGVLTYVLLDEGFDVTAVEKDLRFASRLSPHPQLKVVEADILRFDLARWISDHKDRGPLAICGNIPYHISSDILFWFLPFLPSFAVGAFLVQKEFAERVAAKSGCKAYGSLSIYSQLRSKTHVEFLVPKELFRPMPKVDSAVISLRPLLEIPSSDALAAVEQLTLKAFSQRRKKLSNSLSSFIEQSSEFTKAVEPWKNLRCENLSPEDFLKLGCLLSKNANDLI